MWYANRELQEKSAEYIKTIYPEIEHVVMCDASIEGLVEQEWVTVPIPQWLWDYRERLYDNTKTYNWGEVVDTGRLLTVRYKGELYKVTPPPSGYQYCPECKSHYRLKGQRHKKWSREGFCWPCYDGLYDMCYGPEEKDFDYIRPDIFFLQLSEQEKKNRLEVVRFFEREIEIGDQFGFWIDTKESLKTQLKRQRELASYPVYKD
jgi:hypothetical protein